MKTKNTLVSIAATALIALSLPLINGCGTVGGVYSKQAVVTPATNYVATVSTITSNVVDQTTGKTNTVETLITNVAPVVSLQTNYAYSISTNTATALAAGQAIAPYIPQPFGGLLSIFLGAAAAGLGVLAKVKSSQALKNAKAFEQAAAVTEAIIAGVEIAGDKLTKFRIQQAATAANVQDSLDRTVQIVSRQMPVTPPTPASLSIQPQPSTVTR